MVEEADEHPDLVEEQVGGDVGREVVTQHQDHAEG